MTLLSLFQITIIILIYFAVYAFIILYKKFQLNKKTRSPFTDDALLRLPGHSLNKEINDLKEGMDMDLIGIFFYSNMLVSAIAINIAQKAGQMAFKLVRKCYG